MPVVVLKPRVAQHMEALARANAIRLGRARLRRDIATGQRALADVIADPPADMVTATVGDVLAWQHRWGDARVRRFLAELRVQRTLFVSEARPLGALTQRERYQLAAEFRGERRDDGTS